MNSYMWTCADTGCTLEDLPGVMDVLLERFDDGGDDGCSYQQHRKPVKFDFFSLLLYFNAVELSN